MRIVLEQGENKFCGNTQWLGTTRVSSISWKEDRLRHLFYLENFHDFCWGRLQWIFTSQANFALSEAFSLLDLFFFGMVVCDTSLGSFGAYLFNNNCSSIVLAKQELLQTYNRTCKERPDLNQNRDLDSLGILLNVVVWGFLFAPLFMSFFVLYRFDPVIHIMDLVYPIESNCVFRLFSICFSIRIVLQTFLVCGTSRTVSFVTIIIMVGIKILLFSAKDLRDRLN